MTWGIYVVRVRGFEAVYVGHAQHVEARWRGHIRLLRSGVHHCRKLQKAFDSAGQLALEFELVELCYHSDKRMLREAWWMTQFPVLFNSLVIGAPKAAKGAQLAGPSPPEKPAPLVLKTRVRRVVRTPALEPEPEPESAPAIGSPILKQRPSPIAWVPPRCSTSLPKSMQPPTPEDRRLATGFARLVAYQSIPITTEAEYWERLRERRQERQVRRPKPATVPAEHAKDVPDTPIHLEIAGDPPEREGDDDEHT